MSSNSLVSFRGLVSTEKTKTILGEVTKKSKNKLTVTLTAGNTLTVWGTANVGDSVLIRDKSVIAVVGKENVQQVRIP